MLQKQKADFLRLDETSSTALVDLADCFERAVVYATLTFKQHFWSVNFESEIVCE